ncbi:hypothetical protein MRX96_008406 [Rhipicephalus microplus]
MPKHDTSKSKKTLVKRIFQRRKDPQRTSPLVPITVRRDGSCTIEIRRYVGLPLKNCLHHSSRRLHPPL